MKVVLNGNETRVSHEEMLLIKDVFEGINRDREQADLLPLQVEITNFIIADHEKN